MTVEFTGMIDFVPGSEIYPTSKAGLDQRHIEHSARVHEDAGFDRVLLPFGSYTPEGMIVATHIATMTKRLAFMIAHRPGFTAPTVAARQLATIDSLTGGRVGVHIITGGADAEMARDGDHLTKDERYARTDEYLTLLRQEWMSASPFDYQGNHYNVTAAFAKVKPAQTPHIPIYFGGLSDVAIRVGAKHADIYAIWGEALDEVREVTSRIRREAAAHQRRMKFSISFRPILGDTEEAAWKRADEFLARAREVRIQAGLPVSGHDPANVGSKRMLKVASRGARLDKCLWTEMTALTGSPGNSTGLVGTPEQVADALMDYYDLGVTTFLIRGFDPLSDAEDYGRSLIPLVRAMVAKRASADQAATA